MTGKETETKTTANETPNHLSRLFKFAGLAGRFCLNDAGWSVLASTPVAQQGFVEIMELLTPLPTVINLTSQEEEQV